MNNVFCEKLFETLLSPKTNNEILRNEKKYFKDTFEKKNLN